MCKKTLPPPTDGRQSHVRKRQPRRVTTSRNWVAHSNDPLPVYTLCGAEVTDRDLNVSDVLRAGRLVRGGKDLDEWITCAECRDIVRRMVRAA